MKKPRRRLRRTCRSRRRPSRYRTRSQRSISCKANPLNLHSEPSQQAPKKPKSKPPKKAAEAAETSEHKKKPGKKARSSEQPELEPEEETKSSPSKRAAEQAEPEKSKKKTKSAVDTHLEMLRGLKTEAQREEYLGSITLSMRMKVAEAQSMCADTLPVVEESEPAPPVKNDKKRGKAKPASIEEEPEEAPAPSAAPASSGRSKRAAAQQAEPEEVKKPRKFSATVEKHMDELAKLKTQKQKEKYIGKLTLNMQTKVAAALSEADAPTTKEAEEAPEEANGKGKEPAKKRGAAGDPKEKDPPSKAPQPPERERERERAILAQVFPPLSWGRRSLEPQPGGCFGCPAEGELQIPRGGLESSVRNICQPKAATGGAKTASCCPA